MLSILLVLVRCLYPYYIVILPICVVKSTLYKYQHSVHLNHAHEVVKSTVEGLFRLYLKNVI